MTVLRGASNHCSMVASCTHLRSISYLLLAQGIRLTWRWVTWRIDRDNEGIFRLIGMSYLCPLMLVS